MRKGFVLRGKKLGEDEEENGRGEGRVYSGGIKAGFMAASA